MPTAMTTYATPPPDASERLLEVFKALAEPHLADLLGRSL